MSESLDLDNANDAFYFLKSLKVGGNYLEYVGLSYGKKLFIKDMTDEQAIKYAKEIFTNFFDGKNGDVVLLEPLQ